MSVVSNVADHADVSESKGSDITSILDCWIVLLVLPMFFAPDALCPVPTAFGFGVAALLPLTAMLTRNHYTIQGNRYLLLPIPARFYPSHHPWVCLGKGSESEITVLYLLISWVDDIDDAAPKASIAGDMWYVIFS
jgi:hypothetical protein